MTDNLLPPIGLGCARIGSFNNPATPAQSRALIAAALDAGIRIFDTSNVYGQGDSERTLGAVLRGRRGDAFVVTKVGKKFSTKMRLLQPFKPLIRPLIAARGLSAAVSQQRTANIGQDFDAAVIERNLDASLRRLRTDYVDGYLLHSPNAATAADPAVAAELARLKAAGKIRHFGVSVDTIDVLEAALAMPGLGILQLPWDVIGQARSQGIAAQIKARGIIVHAREIIVMQRGIDPLEAVRNAIADDMVDAALIGTTSIAHLRAIALPLLQG